ncbi:hypothetical protein AB833_00410, partial [Chromatiales bacterium (ex Bugula neritina AB1)]
VQADSLHRAWAAINSNDFQVVIANGDQPTVQGETLCRRTRQKHPDQYIYFVLLTARNNSATMYDGIDAGADDFLDVFPSDTQLLVSLRSARRFLDMETRLTQKHLDLESAHNTIRADLQSAAKTQLALLPQPLNEPPLLVRWAYRPAIFIGGDTFNFFPISKTRWLFYNIDVSGHGLSAAFLSIHLQAHINSLAQTLTTTLLSQNDMKTFPAQFAKNLNRVVESTDSGHYLTMIFGFIDLESSSIHYVQAGHPHPWLYRANNTGPAPLKSNGYPVGMFSEVDWSTQSTTFGYGDKFVVYSDGLIENTVLDIHSEAESDLVDGSNESSFVNSFENSFENSTPNGVTQPETSGEPVSALFSDLCDSADKSDLDKKVNYWVTKDGKQTITDDINVLIFENRYAA